MNILLLADDYKGPGVNYDTVISKEFLTKKKIAVTIFHFGTFNDPKNEIYSFKNKNIFRLLTNFKKIYLSNKIPIGPFKRYNGKKSCFMGIMFVFY